MSNISDDLGNKPKLFLAISFLSLVFLKASFLPTLITSYVPIQKSFSLSLTELGWIASLFSLSSLVGIIFFAYTIQSLYPKVQIIILSLIIFANLVTNYIYQPIDKNDQHLANFLENCSKPEEKIFFYPNEHKYLMEFHYSGSSDLIPIPNEIDFDKGYKIADWVIRDEEQIDSFFNEHTGARPSMFYIIKENNFDAMYNVAFKPEILYQYLNNHYQKITDTLVADHRVTKYCK